MTATWYVTKPASGRAERPLSSGLEGEWVLADGPTILGKGRSHQMSSRFEIEANGRTYAADMPGRKEVGQETALTVDDATSGRRLLDAVRTEWSDPAAIGTRERWTVNVVDGPALEWVFREDPPEVGFYDAGGNRLMTFGHDVPMDLTSGGGGTLRMLLRFWLRTAQAQQQYAVHVDEEQLATSVPGVDPPFLALLGMWLCRRWDLKSRSGATGYTA